MSRPRLLILIFTLVLGITPVLGTQGVLKLISHRTSSDTPILVKVIGGLGEYKEDPDSPSFRCEIYPHSIRLRHYVEKNGKVYDLMVDKPRFMQQHEYEEIKDLIEDAYLAQAEVRTERLYNRRSPTEKIAAQYTFTSQETYSREVSTRVTLLSKSNGSKSQIQGSAAQELINYVNKACVPESDLPTQYDFSTRRRSF